SSCSKAFQFFLILLPLNFFKQSLIFFKFLLFVFNQSFWSFFDKALICKHFLRSIDFKHQFFNFLFLFLFFPFAVNKLPKWNKYLAVFCKQFYAFFFWLFFNNHSFASKSKFAN